MKVFHLIPNEDGHTKALCACSPVEETLSMWAKGGPSETVVFHREIGEANDTAVDSVL